MTAVRVTALISGRVQGVGFRDWTRRVATRLGLTGRATNLADGRVEVVAEGTRTACEQLVAALRGGSTPGSVRSVDVDWAAADGSFTGFAVG